MEKPEDGAEDSWLLPISYDSFLSVAQLLNPSARVRLSLACHALREIISDPNCWRTCSFQRQPNGSDAVLKSCSQFMADCRQLDLTNCGDLTAQTIQYLLDNSCTRLADLKIRGAAGIAKDDTILPKFLRACTGLSSLVMDSKTTNMRWEATVACVPQLTSLSSVGNSKIDSGIDTLAHFSRLRYLDLTGCYRISTVSLVAFFTLSRSTSLEWLSLKGIPQCYDDCITALAQSAFCSTLKHLDIGGIGTIMDVGMSQMGSRLCSLTSLDCLSLGRVTDSCWAAALGNWPQLVHLNLGRCALVGPQALKSIGAVCTSVEHLDLTRCDVDDDSLWHLQSCTRLKTLELSRCDRLHRLDSLIPALKQLHTIALVGLKCIHWTSFFEALVAHCHSVVKLDLASTEVEDSDLAILSGASFLHCFTHLSLQFCQLVGDEALLSPSGFVQRVLAARDYLSDGQKFSLNICGCDRITNNALKQLRQQVIDDQVHPRLHLRCIKDLRKPGQGGCSCSMRPAVVSQ